MKNLKKVGLVNIETNYFLNQQDLNIIININDSSRGVMHCIKLT